MSGADPTVPPEAAVLDPSAPAAPGPVAAEDSLRRRYVFKLANNVVGAAFNLVALTLVPRAFGAARYGDYNFLTSFFTQAVGFLDGGSSTGFYTRLSQRPADAGLVRFYWAYVAAVVAAVAAGVAAVQACGAAPSVWPHQAARFVWMAAGLGLASWIVAVVCQVVDAHGFTVQGETARVLQRFLSALLLTALGLGAWLSMTSYFLYNYAMMGLICVLWWRLLKRRGVALFPRTALSWREAKGYGREIYDFAHPLFAYAVVGAFTGILDRWILQRVGGPVQQGHFGLSAQVGNLCLLFTSAMTPLFAREFARAHHAGDRARMRDLFDRHVPRFHFMAAFFGVFFASQAGTLSRLFGGAEFTGAAFPMAVMAFFPIHQTYGQLGSAVFFATGQTRLYRNLGVANMLGGLVLTYLLLAPRGMGGLEAGAAGLAVKFVALQFVGVNVMLWFITRDLGLSFGRLLWQQVHCVGALVLLAWAARWPAGSAAPVAGVVISGAVYAALCAAVGFAFPAAFGLVRQDFDEALRTVLGRAAGAR